MTEKNWLEKLIDTFSSSDVSDWSVPDTAFPKHWRVLLAQNVPYYNSLEADEKVKFESRLHEFSTNVTITGVDVEVEELDRLMIAASAIIPIFGFAHWRFDGLKEVLLYSDRFNRQFETEGEDRNINGMVGTGFLNGKMALSRNALYFGLKNESDGRNTAIHEFIHLLDKDDMDIDGLPTALLDTTASGPWLKMVEKKILDINTGHSNIRPYGGTNPQEFFAVAGEHFFERPDQLRDDHPDLYAMLVDIFDQDMVSRYPKMEMREFKRNDPCPCGSGKKFKKCCLAA